MEPASLSPHSEGNKTISEDEKDKELHSLLLYSDRTQSMTTSDCVEEPPETPASPKVSHCSKTDGAISASEEDPAEFKLTKEHEAYVKMLTVRYSITFLSKQISNLNAVMTSLQTFMKTSGTKSEMKICVTDKSFKKMNKTITDCMVSIIRSSSPQETI